jgi:hypothetical protein
VAGIYCHTSEHSPADQLVNPWLIPYLGSSRDCAAVNTKSPWRRAYTIWTIISLLVNRTTRRYFGALLQISAGAKDPMSMRHTIYSWPE